MSEESKPSPPHSGQWKPGQSGNPKGRPKSRPYKDALDRVLQAIGEASGKDINHAYDQIAAAHVSRCMTGDMAAIKEFAERHDGKVPQAVIGGDEDDPAIAISVIERRIVNAANPDISSVRASTTTEPV